MAPVTRKRKAPTDVVEEVIEVPRTTRTRAGAKKVETAKKPKTNTPLTPSIPQQLSPSHDAEGENLDSIAPVEEQEVDSVEVISEEVAPAETDGNETNLVSHQDGSSAKEGMIMIGEANFREPVLGRNVSGRKFKTRVQSQRAIKQRTAGTKELSSTWQKKIELKNKLAAVRTMEKEMKEAEKTKAEEEKTAKLEREKRRQQNEIKNTQMQTITKAHKLKGMSKKQLRQVKKMQVNQKTGEVELVSPWTGKK